MLATRYLTTTLIKRKENNERAHISESKTKTNIKAQQNVYNVCTQGTREQWQSSEHAGESLYQRRGEGVLFGASYHVGSVVYLWVAENRDTLEPW